MYLLQSGSQCVALVDPLLKIILHYSPEFCNYKHEPPYKAKDLFFEDFGILFFFFLDWFGEDEVKTKLVVRF